MEFKRQIEKLRTVMHRAADAVADALLKKKDTLSNEEIHEIFKTNLDQYLKDLLCDILNVDQPLVRPEINLWEILVIHERHDLIDLLHQAEKGILIGKKVTFYKKATPDFIMNEIKNFLHKCAVEVEVKA